MQVTTPPETAELLREIEDVFTKTAAHVIYRHKVRMRLPGKSLGACRNPLPCIRVAAFHQGPPFASGLLPSIKGSVGGASLTGDSSQAALHAAVDACAAASRPCHACCLRLLVPAAVAARRLSDFRQPGTRTRGGTRHAAAAG